MTLTFITIATVLLLSCNKRFYVDFTKITFEKIELTKIGSTDSIHLELGYSFAPKSFGKKAIVVCQPVIIDHKDTIKFHTSTSPGEKYVDATIVFYKEGGYGGLIDTLKLPKLLSDSAMFKILFTYYKGGEKPVVVYQKKIRDLLKQPE